MDKKDEITLYVNLFNKSIEVDKLCVEKLGKNLLHVLFDRDLNLVSYKSIRNLDGNDLDTKQLESLFSGFNKYMSNNISKILNSNVKNKTIAAEISKAITEIPYKDEDSTVDDSVRYSYKFSRIRLSSVLLMNDMGHSGINKFKDLFTGTYGIYFMPALFGNVYGDVLFLKNNSTSINDMTISLGSSALNSYNGDHLGNYLKIRCRCLTTMPDESQNNNTFMNLVSNMVCGCWYKSFMIAGERFVDSMENGFRIEDVPNIKKQIVENAVDIAREIFIEYENAITSIPGIDVSSENTFWDFFVKKYNNITKHFTSNNCENIKNYTRGLISNDILESIEKSSKFIIPAKVCNFGSLLSKTSHSSFMQLAPVILSTNVLKSDKIPTAVDIIFALNTFIESTFKILTDESIRNKEEEILGAFAIAKEDFPEKYVEFVCTDFSKNLTETFAIPKASTVFSSMINIKDHRKYLDNEITRDTLLSAINNDVLREETKNWIDEYTDSDGYYASILSGSKKFKQLYEYFVGISGINSISSIRIRSSKIESIKSYNFGLMSKFSDFVKRIYNYNLFYKGTSLEQKKRSIQQNPSQQRKPLIRTSSGMMSNKKSIKFLGGEENELNNANIVMFMMFALFVVFLVTITIIIISLLVSRNEPIIKHI